MPDGSLHQPFEERFMARTLFLIAAALGPLTAGLAGPGQAFDQAEGWVKLFNGRDFTGWTIFLRDNPDPSQTFSVKGGIIHCTGKPNGYLLTEKEYGNYVLRVQWRFPAAPGNSGVFVHVSGSDRIWPKGVEAQLASGRAGDIWLVEGFQLKVDPARRDPRRGLERHFARIGDRFVKKDGKDKQGRDLYDIVGKTVEKPLGEWNQYEITCQDDTIKLVVNGTLVNEGTQAEATRGKILLQSEGTPIEFRNVEIKLLK
jgi:hypothetical protein